MKLFKLIENEVTKTLLKKRLWVVIAILAILTMLFAYGEQYRAQRTEERLLRRLGDVENVDAMTLLNQQIIDLRSQLNRPFITDERRASILVQIEQLEYYQERGINPFTPSTAGFTKTFMENIIALFLPLLIVILACDLVSGEFTGGAIKLLLTTPIPRWKVLLSKYLALLIMTTVVVLLAGILSIIIASFYFGFTGFTTPITTGFRVVADRLDTSFVRNIPQWQYLIMVYGLAWFVSICVATISFMVSVIVKSTAVAMGVMLSSLITGTFMAFFLSDWPMVKYLFITNMRLPDYLSGAVQPVEGMTLGFSVAVLSVWTVVTLLVSFFVFTKQDVLV